MRNNREVKGKVQNRKVKRLRKASYHKGLAVVSISLVVIMLMAVLLVQGNVVRQKIDSSIAKEKEIEQQIEEEHARTEEIEATQEYMKTPEYIEEAARDNGLIKDNQIIFKEVK